LESSPEKVVQLGRLSDTAAAQLLLSLAPPGCKLEEVTVHPNATRDEAYAELASSPVLAELHGHPRAIVTFAPLLEENKLEELLERAKECYAEATKTRTPVVNERREEASGGLPGIMRDGPGDSMEGEVMWSYRRGR